MSGKLSGRGRIEVVVVQTRRLLVELLRVGPASLPDYRILVRGRRLTGSVRLLSQGLGPALPGLLFERCLRLPNALSTLLTPLQLLGNVPLRLADTQSCVVLGVGSFRLGEDLLDLLPQTTLELHHARMAHRLVLAGVALDLRAVDGDVAQLDQTRLLAQTQHLEKQTLKLRLVLSTEATDAGVIRVVAPRHHAEGHVLVRRPLQATRRPDPEAVAVDQQSHHHPR